MNRREDFVLPLRDRQQRVAMTNRRPAELFFDNLRISADQLLGDENQGFRYLMQGLPQERLLISVQCQSRAEAAFGWTVDNV